MPLTTLHHERVLAESSCVDGENNFMTRVPWSAKYRDELFYMSSVDARLAPCPSCGAQPEKFCVTATGKERAEAHASRWHASRKQLLEVRRSVSKDNSTRRSSDR